MYSVVVVVVVVLCVHLSALGEKRAPTGDVFYKGAERRKRERRRQQQFFPAQFRSDEFVLECALLSATAAQ